jgi:transcription-repair coupling factor (superfamily II helicase)
MRFVILTDGDMFGSQLRRARQTKTKGSKIASFTELKIGDYVVHEAHGIGVYKGIVRLQSEGHWREYLFIQYQETDKLYVPTDQMDRVQKYIGGESSAPRLSRLGGGEWNKQKAKVKQSIRQMAFDLVKLYAQRSTAHGFAFSKDTPWQSQFEEFFPYEETPDQLQAVEEIKRDMEHSTPMDRLLCGDVGYGKTEVALRAAFKAVMDSRQVAILAPTTVLTEQHFHTIQERFQGFPVRAASLSRFRTQSEQKEILAKLAQGYIDIVVGTHRLLAKDVKFKQLGLLVVDEEQRFGVAHKESIKNLRREVDVLTLSATPIPRTLHMSMVGIRDMSLLETPPEERYPIQTYVVEYSDGLVRDSILRELGRGGQVYFVYNHVETIELMYARLHDLVPEAKIAIGHGQMQEHMLEDVMLDFYDGRYDVLLCTTIIESGLDVPRANTLIVWEADHFGLAQLYQLRGRVGRSNRIAYAYLTLKPDRTVSETADKRLQAIREFTEFGSGFRIAMRDLEIRGAGNLLGAEQSGFLTVVGYDMYCRLLEQTVREIRGDEPEEEAIETRVEFSVDAFIPKEYIESERQRIELYQRIAEVSDRTARSDLEDELTDRFGDIPEETLRLLDIALLKNKLNKQGVDLISHRGNQVKMRFAAKAKPDLVRLIKGMEPFGSRIALVRDILPQMVLKNVPSNGAKALTETLAAMEKILG